MTIAGRRSSDRFRCHKPQRRRSRKVREGGGGVLRGRSKVLLDPWNHRKGPAGRTVDQAPPAPPPPRWEPQRSDQQGGRVRTRNPLVPDWTLARFPWKELRLSFRLSFKTGQSGRENPEYSPPSCLAADWRGGGEAFAARGVRPITSASARPPAGPVNQSRGAEQPARPLAAKTTLILSVRRSLRANNTL